MQIKLILTTFLSLLFIGSNCKANFHADKLENAGIVFDHSAWKEVLEKSESSGKLIFLDCYTTWCGPCKMMAKNVFTDAEVGDVFNNTFINVKLDMEKEPGLSLKKQLNVTAFPTLIIIDSKLQIVHKAVGALSKEDFLKFAEEAFGESKNLSWYNERYKTQEVLDYQFVVDYMNILEFAGEKERIEEVISKYFDALNTNDLLLEQNWKLLNKYVHNTESKAFQFFLSNRTEFEKAFGKNEIEEKIYFTFLRQGNQLCDKLESGTFQLNTGRKERFEFDLEKFNVENRNKILAYSKISIFRTLEDWDGYVSVITMNLKSELIDNSVMSLYNYALPVNRGTENKDLRKEAAKWCDMGLKTKNLDEGFKNAFLKLKAELLKQD